MSLQKKFAKGFRLLSRRSFVSAVARYGVAAAVEHIEAIRLTAPATLLDVGANKGQFALAYLALNPGGSVVAFEPLDRSAESFERVFAGHRNVSLNRCALSDFNGTADFHVTDRADSSSLLTPGAAQQKAFAVVEETVTPVAVHRLDTVLASIQLNRPVLMKIDVQGAELSVIEGCVDLSSIDFIYVELSFVELYDHQPLFHDVAVRLFERGFELAGVFNQVSTRTFGPTQADFLFRQVGATQAA